MLKVLREGEGYPEDCALLLGGFDGFHAGHMTLLSAAQKTGLPVGLTTFSDGKAGGNIFTFSEREYVFNRAGCAFALEILFSEAFRNTPAEEFLRALFSRINAKAVFCGEDFRFGSGALGTPELLKKLAPCPVHVLPLMTAEGKKVATSEIKIMLGNGRVKDVNGLLICDYFIEGNVERGRGVGHTYGFPTLNLAYPTGKFLIREGVYGGYAKTSAGEYPALINFGARPTFGVSEKKLEVWLDGFNGDLYGGQVRVFFTDFIRSVKKFASREELTAQLNRDAVRIRGGNK